MGPSGELIASMAPIGNDHVPSIRTLVIGERFPWPQDHGAAMRLANVIEGLAQLGQVDLFALIHPEEVGRCRLPDDAPVARVATVARGAPALTRALRMSWLTVGRLPLELFGRDYGPARDTFRKWERGPYDLAWFGDAEAFVALGRHVHAPAMVDFDDLEDHTGWLKAPDGDANEPSGLLQELHRRVANFERRLRNERNERLWRRLQQRTAESVAAVAVCSELDRSRFHLPGSVVVPNGYTLEGEPLGRAQVGSPPTILMPGYLRYAPNVDAATRLVREIAPQLRRQLPGVRVRLVGLADQRVEQLHSPPQVVVTGRVEDMASELAVADLLAVPLRHGAGTRIKILEAFAHRIPVVSTTVGAEGLDVRDGEHILVRDGDDEFVGGCLSLLQDERRRAVLVDKAWTLYQERYRWDRIHKLIADIGAGLVRDGRA